MFSTVSSSSMSISKPNPFDVYPHIATQYTNIKGLSSFTNYTQLSPTDLITITNINLDIMERMSDVSAFFIKKLTDPSISTSVNDKLVRMFELHNDLLKLIIQFNSISTETANAIQDISTHQYSQDVVGYTYYDVVNRHKMMIMMMMDCIKKLNIYNSILKDKLL